MIPFVAGRTKSIARLHFAQPRLSHESAGEEGRRANAGGAVTWSGPRRPCGDGGDRDDDSTIRRVLSTLWVRTRLNLLGD